MGDSTERSAVLKVILLHGAFKAELENQKLLKHDKSSVILQAKQKEVVDSGLATLPLVPGERLLRSDRLPGGRLLLSNYRLCLLQDRQTPVVAPLGLIESVLEISDLQLHVLGKDASSFRLSFASAESRGAWLSAVADSLPAPPPRAPTDSFSRLFRAGCEADGASGPYGRLVTAPAGRSPLDAYLSEVTRLGFDLHGAWRISKANEKYDLCPSYPRYLLVPTTVGDVDLKRAAEFRGNRRIPAVCWRHRSTGAVMVRSAQPSLGWTGSGCPADLHLVDAIRTACALRPATPAGQPGPSAKGAAASRPHSPGAGRRPAREDGSVAAGGQAVDSGRGRRSEDSSPALQRAPVDDGGSDEKRSPSAPVPDRLADPQGHTAARQRLSSNGHSPVSERPSSNEHTPVKDLSPSNGHTPVKCQSSSNEHTPVKGPSSNGNTPVKDSPASNGHTPVKVHTPDRSPALDSVSAAPQYSVPGGGHRPRRTSTSAASPPDAGEPSFGTSPGDLAEEARLLGTPQVRLTAGASSGDLAEEARLLGTPQRLMIVDARSYVAATANRARGGGVESGPEYGDSEVVFLGLPNIHAVSRAWDTLRRLLARTEPSSGWLESLGSSCWLEYVAALLRSAAAVARYMDDQGRPVLVHCSDGWDRTPQITSLAQLLMDPHYRTVQGFRTLVEREWLQFGHKFADRCGSAGACVQPSQRSPVFLQWLDCVHQLTRQFPCAFEFNGAYLAKLAQHAYSELFGTFLLNTTQEREEANLATTTCSVFVYLDSERDLLTNNLYLAADGVLEPSCHPGGMMLWTALYRRHQAPFVAVRPADVDSAARAGPGHDLDLDLRRGVGLADLGTGPIGSGHDSCPELTDCRQESPEPAQPHCQPRPKPTAFCPSHSHTCFVLPDSGEERSSSRQDESGSFDRSDSIIVLSDSANRPEGFDGAGFDVCAGQQDVSPGQSGPCTGRAHPLGQLGAAVAGPPAEETFPGSESSSTVCSGRLPARPEGGSADPSGTSRDRPSSSRPPAPADSSTTEAAGDGRAETTAATGADDVHVKTTADSRGDDFQEVTTTNTRRDEMREETAADSRGDDFQKVTTTNTRRDEMREETAADSRGDAVQEITANARDNVQEETVVEARGDEVQEETTAATGRGDVQEEIAADTGGKDVLETVTVAAADDVQKVVTAIIGDDLQEDSAATNGESDLCVGDVPFCSDISLPHGIAEGTDDENEDSSSDDGKGDVHSSSVDEIVEEMLRRAEVYRVIHPMARAGDTSQTISPASDESRLENFANAATSAGEKGAVSAPEGGGDVSAPAASSEGNCGSVFVHGGSGSAVENLYENDKPTFSDMLGNSTPTFDEEREAQALADPVREGESSGSGLQENDVPAFNTEIYESRPSLENCLCLDGLPAAIDDVQKRFRQLSRSHKDEVKRLRRALRRALETVDRLQCRRCS